MQVAFLADLLASASVSDNMIRLWDPTTGALVREFPDITRHATDAGQGPSALAFSPGRRGAVHQQRRERAHRVGPVSG